MDIIPIIPAPQQGQSPHSVELPTGSGETGFDKVLSQELPNHEPLSLPRQTDTLQNNKNIPDSLNQSEQTKDVFSDLFSTLESSHRLQAKDLTSQDIDQLLSEDEQPQTVTTDPDPGIKTGLGTFEQPNFITQLGPFVDLRDPQPLLGQADNRWIEQFSAENLQKSPGDGRSILASLLQPGTAEPKGSTGIAVDNYLFSRELTLQLNSSASAFSIKSTEAVSIAGDKTFINAGIELLTSYFRNNQGANPDEALGNSFKADSQVPLTAEPQSFNTGYTPERGGAVFEPSLFSIFMKGQPEINFPGQTAHTGQPTIMLEEIQRLISQNNDTVNMEVSFETRMTARKAIGNLVNPAILQNAEAQISPTQTAAKVNTTSALETVLNSSEILPQSKTDHLRDSIRDNVQEQTFNAKSGAIAKNAENNANNQTLQQNSNSPDNNSLQQQTVNTAPNNNAVSTEQSTLNSTFGSQFHDIASTQTTETVKMGASPSPQSNFVREQEIINQIVERFSVQSRLQTSRLSLQLNPAELGELKIDLFVKGDILKANIYAQTHQAGEIIDKNLPRLREILQNQGISVEDLVVSFKSDTIDDFTSQHGQLFQDQTPLFKDQPKTQTTSKFEIEDTLLTNATEQSGVNLTI